MTALGARNRISGKAGYVWLERYRRGGFGALSDLSRARSTRAEATPEWMSRIIRSLREEHPHCGCKKLPAVLARAWPAFSWPAASTIVDLLKCHGLVRARQVRSSGLPQTRVCHRQQAHLVTKETFWITSGREATKWNGRNGSLITTKSPVSRTLFLSRRTAVSLECGLWATITV